MMRMGLILDLMHWKFRSSKYHQHKSVFDMYLLFFLGWLHLCFVHCFLLLVVYIYASGISLSIQWPVNFLKASSHWLVWRKCKTGIFWFIIVLYWLSTPSFKYWSSSIMLCSYLQNNQYTGNIDVLANLPLDNLWVMHIFVCVNVIPDVKCFISRLSAIYCLSCWFLYALGILKTISLLARYLRS